MGQLYEGGVIFSLDKTNYSIGIISNITSSKLMSWPEAKRFVDNMELNGYDDWEMPTQNELKKVKNNINLINQSFNNNFSYSRNLQNIDYWSNDAWATFSFENNAKKLLLKTEQLEQFATHILNN